MHRDSLRSLLHLLVVRKQSFLRAVVHGIICARFLSGLPEPNRAVVRFRALRRSLVGALGLCDCALYSGLETVPPHYMEFDL